jgi:hypothetical protein
MLSPLPIIEVLPVWKYPDINACLCLKYDLGQINAWHDYLSRHLSLGQHQ